MILASLWSSFGEFWCVMSEEHYFDIEWFPRKKADQVCRQVDFPEELASGDWWSENLFLHTNLWC